MSKRLGEYVPLSAKYADDDAILSLSPLAELLYLRSLALAASLPSDGYLTEAQVQHRAARGLGSSKVVGKLIAELTASGLWLAESGGYIIRGWLKWNKSTEDLGRERAKDRDRKRGQRHEQAGEEPFLRPGDESHVQGDSAVCPPGHVTDSSGTDDGIQPDSSGSPGGVQPDSSGSPGGVQPDSSGSPGGVQPDSSGSPGGVQPDSGRSPASRAPARTGVRRAVGGKDRNEHGTARHDTLPDMPDGPPEEPETAATRANRLARVYTDEVRVSNFPAVAKIVRKAVDADVSDEAIIAGLKKVIADNVSLTTESLRVAIYGPPRQSTANDRVQQALAAAERAQQIADQAGGGS